MLAFSVPPGYRRSRPPARPKLDPFVSIIDQILEDDKGRPAKQRHTSKRIFERLRDEHGYAGGLTIVKDYVLGQRQRQREMFVPLVHPPGHAQADFGEAVGIIGTGATAVQTIQTIAKTVGQLTVFQRTPNWVFPLNNSKITPDEMRDIRDRYPEILARCRETPSCYIHGPDPRKTLGVSPEDREAFWEKLYRTPGFGQWQANFSDMLTDREANALASEFAARKIRERVKDPAVAEKLIPKNHGFGTRRIPLESGYYEVYNQPNVELVDVNETPIERITPHGIRTSDREREFDVIIYATGFDAITGAFDRIDIRGVDGVLLKEVWKDGPQTYLGVFVAGFPNFLMAMGPHAGLSNYTRTAEYSVEWVTGVIRFATERGLRRIEASPSAVSEWTDHVLALGQGQLMNEVGSWMTGVNRNVEGKQKPRIMRYSGGHPAYRQYCDAVAADDYRKLAY